MTTRSLTEVFVLMRNNAMQNRNIYNEQRINDRVALVDNDSEDLELGKIPPSWTSQVEETQYTAVRLKGKIQQLAELHSRAISRPTLDDGTSDEKLIETLTQEISRMFNSAHRLVSQIRTEAQYTKSVQERTLAQSVVAALVATLQELSLEFRQLQANYFNKLKSREERSRAYFEVDLGTQQDEESAISEFSWGQQSQDMQSLIQLESNSSEILRREKEVKYIVDSILDLNALFKDLSQLVTDQGTILDRIDYNIENTQLQVSQGTKQLVKAAQYQKSNRKMLCIVLLGTVTTFLTALLIIVKT